MPHTRHIGHGNAVRNHFLREPIDVRAQPPVVAGCAGDQGETIAQMALHDALGGERRRARAAWGLRVTSEVLVRKLERSDPEASVTASRGDGSEEG